METIIVAFESEEQSRRIRDLLEGGAVGGCVICHSGDQVRRALHQHQVYCAVCGCHLPDGMAEWLYEDFPPAASMLLIGPQYQLDLCSNQEIVKLATPVSKGEVVSTVRLMMQYGYRLERLLRVRRSPLDQQVVERAKTLLMARRSLSEEQAHRLIQKRSMDCGSKLERAARQLIDELS